MLSVAYLETLKAPTIAKAENSAYDATSLVSVAIYNNMYEKVINSYENDEPYMSMGGADLYADDELYQKFNSWGRMGVHIGDFKDGTPKIITHDGVDLAKDVENISGKVGDYVSLFKAIKVYPVIDLRLTHRIF